MESSDSFYDAPDWPRWPRRAFKIMIQAQKMSRHLKVIAGLSCLALALLAATVFRPGLPSDLREKLDEAEDLELVSLGNESRFRLLRNFSGRG